MDKALLTRNISVLIPTHGRSTLLGRTLASLAECCIPAGYVETVVVENGPKSGAEHVVADSAVQWPHLKLRYLHVPRANKSHALNEALGTVGDGLVVFFDDDVRLDPGVLEAYAKVAAEHGAGGAYFGGAFECDYESIPVEWVKSLFPISAQGMRFDGDWVPDFFLGFNWAAFTSDLRACGGFDTNFGPGASTGATGQESTMQKRLKARGVAPVQVPAALVWHYVPAASSTPGWAVRRMFRQGTGWGRESFILNQESGVFLDAIREIAYCAASVAKRALLRDRPGMYKAAARLSIKAGFVRGYLQAIREERACAAGSAIPMPEASQW